MRLVLVEAVARTSVLEVRGSFRRKAADRKCGGLRYSLIFHPEPEYPALAKMARIQGTVRLAAVISKDGVVQDLKMLSGHPLLAQAAIAAVQKWRYQPTLLSGEPVEVETEITVNFALP